MTIRYKETKYGFNYGSAEITRVHSDGIKEWVILGVKTPKHKGGDMLQVYITKTGKVRVSDSRGEWTPPVEKDRSNVKGAR